MENLINVKCKKGRPYSNNLIKISLYKRNVKYKNFNKEYNYVSFYLCDVVTNHLNIKKGDMISLRYLDGKIGLKKSVESGWKVRETINSSNRKTFTFSIMSIERLLGLEILNYFNKTTKYNNKYIINPSFFINSFIEQPEIIIIL